MTKSSKDQDAPPEKASGPKKNHSEQDMLMILKNQKVMMRAMFVMMKTMAGDMEVAEEIKAQAKINFDYLASREE